MIADVPTPPALRSTPLGHTRTQSATSPFPSSESRSGNHLLKGKHKDSEPFNFAWWDYTPLLEGRKPPVQWTSSSIILFASEVAPAVECLHYPSNKHFTLPNPRPLLSDSASSLYESASVIAASDRDEVIFAFFPGIGIDGVGCFWKKERSIDSWSVREWRTFARGNGVVTARWTKTEREWINASGGDSGPHRLPPLGPFLPGLTPVLIIVTESHLCTAHYFHPQSDQMQEVTASLLRRNEMSDGQQKPFPEPVESPRGFGRCTHATIGFGYEESSIMIATFSVEVPSAPAKNFNPMGPNLDMPLNFGMSEDAVQNSWYDSWREKNAIHLFEVCLVVKGLGFGFKLCASPIAMVRDTISPSQYVTDMLFIPSLSSHAPTPAVPSTPTPANRNVTTPQSSPAPPHASQSPSLNRSPTKGTPPKVGDRPRKRPDLLYLLIYSTGFDHSNSLKSSISLIGCSRGLNGQTQWIAMTLKQFTLPSGIIMFMSPWPQAGSSHTSALAGILDTESRLPSKGKGNQSSQIVGKLQVIRLSGSDFHFDEAYPPVDLVRPVEEFGIDLPFNVAVSPNRSHVCSVSPSVTRGRQCSVVVELHPHKEQTPPMTEHAPERSQKTFAQLVEKALQSRSTRNDVIRLLPTTNLSITDVEEILANVLSDLDKSNGLAFMWMESLIGLSIDIYREFKVQVQANSSSVKDDLSARIETGIDICSVAYCNGLWEDAADAKGFASDTVWTLVSFSTYFIGEVLEKILKAIALHAGNASILTHAFPEDSEKLPDAAPTDVESTVVGSKLVDAPECASALLHFLHPFALENFIFFLKNITRLRGYLANHAKDGDNMQLAREILVDTLTSSCIDLGSLCDALEDVQSEVKSFSDLHPDLSRRCLMALKPPVEFNPLVQGMVARLSRSELIDRTRLFVKPDDLIDGFAALRLSPSAKRYERDIVTREILSPKATLLMCLRCKGKSDPNGTSAVNPTRPLSRRLWQSRNLRCVCGGAWIGTTS